MGAWIEIKFAVKVSVTTFVALFMGAWIEISYCFMYIMGNSVALFMGAWIEIMRDPRRDCDSVGRTLHGCVD